MQKKKKVIIITICSLLAIIITYYLYTNLHNGNNPPLPRFNTYAPPCKKGDIYFDAQHSGEQFCYKPSGKSGDICLLKSNCDSGGCRKKIGPIGTCDDVPFGCNKWIDNYGRTYDVCAD